MRGMKPKGRVKIKWSPNFAYAIGLLTADGCLSTDGRYIELTSKDIEQLHNFQKCLGLEDIKIGTKKSGYGGLGYRVQFGDVLFYRFLESIGLHANKSHTIGTVDVPREYLSHFLRGHLDGDGYFYSYWDPRWKSSFMFYIGFCSASKEHVDWIRLVINKILEITGHITKGKNPVCYQLKYAKIESTKLIRWVYKDAETMYLSRKRLKIERALGIIGERI